MRITARVPNHPFKRIPVDDTFAHFQRFAPRHSQYVTLCYIVHWYIFRPAEKSNGKNS